MVITKARITSYARLSALGCRVHPWTSNADFPVDVPEGVGDLRGISGPGLVNES